MAFSLYVNTRAVHNVTHSFSVDTGTIGQHAYDENLDTVYWITMIQLSNPRHDR